MKRKEFLSSAFASSILLSSGSLISSCNSIGIHSPKYQGKRLIIIQLSGGHDGLFAYSPQKCGLLESKRPNLFKKSQENGILLPNNWILNYHLKSLESFIVDDEIQFLPFVGCPNPNTSHFKSAEIWETAKLPNENKHKTGWLGDLVDSGKLNLEGNELPIINLHDEQSLFDKGISSEAFVWNDLSAFTWYQNELEELLKLENLNQFDLKIRNQFIRLNWVANLNIDKDFSNTDFGLQMAKAAAIINSDLPFKVIHTKLSGFDTHLGEIKRLPQLYLDLAFNLKLLKIKLKELKNWQNTSIFIYSEFGRTIDENKNEGTDHGHAGLSILINNKLNLVDSNTIEINQGYMLPKVDFRQIYNNLSGWLI